MESKQPARHPVVPLRIPHLHIRIVTKAVLHNAWRHSPEVLDSFAPVSSRNICNAASLVVTYGFTVLVAREKDFSVLKAAGTKGGLQTRTVIVYRRTGGSRDKWLSHLELLYTPELL